MKSKKLILQVFRCKAIRRGRRVSFVETSKSRSGSEKKAYSKSWDPPIANSSRNRVISLEYRKYGKQGEANNLRGERNVESSSFT
jgi:hypothetical protein